LNLLVFDIDRAGQLINDQRINQFAPEIMLLSLGAPHQEKVIYQNLSKLPSVKLAIGIGGALDFITGQAIRAPKLLRSIGLEWLWRLIKKPARRRRIFNAVLVFPYIFIKWKYILPWLYRPNVVGLLYKKENEKYKILLVKRSDQDDHWQLPQGGTDSEPLEVAGARELREELGTDKFKTKTVYKNVWRYTFKDRNGKTSYANQRHTGYKGQKQGLYIAEFYGSDQDIKVNFWDHEEWKWIDSEDLIEILHEVRKDSAEIFLKKFSETVKRDK
jgi:8-oxo-dGTP pyrophosphatase MutT (NUDIX family)